MTMHVTALAAMQYFAGLTPRTLPEAIPQSEWWSRMRPQARSEKGPARAARKALKLIKMTGGRLEVAR